MILDITDQGDREEITSDSEEIGGENPVDGDEISNKNDNGSALLALIFIGFKFTIKRLKKTKLNNTLIVAFRLLSA